MRYDLSHGLDGLSHALESSADSSEQRIAEQAHVMARAVRRRRGARHARRVALAACLVAVVTVGSAQLPKLDHDALPVATAPASSVPGETTCGAPLNGDPTVTAPGGNRGTFMGGLLTYEATIGPVIQMVDAMTAIGVADFPPSFIYDVDVRPTDSDRWVRANEAGEPAPTDISSIDFRQIAVVRDGIVVALAEPGHHGPDETWVVPGGLIMGGGDLASCATGEALAPGPATFFGLVEIRGTAVPDGQVHAVIELATVEVPEPDPADKIPFPSSTAFACQKPSILAEENWSNPYGLTIELDVPSTWKSTNTGKRTTRLMETSGSTLVLETPLNATLVLLDEQDGRVVGHAVPIWDEPTKSSVLKPRGTLVAKSTYDVRMCGGADHPDRPTTETFVAAAYADIDLEKVTDAFGTTDDLGLERVLVVGEQFPLTLTR